MYTLAMNPANSSMYCREKLLGGLVGDAPIVGDQAAFELNVRLDGIHQR